MNEEIEYAEMLEIPVSTVNVVQKKRRRKIRDNDSSSASTPFKDNLIAQINERMREPAPQSEESPAAQITTDAALFTEAANSEGRLDFEPLDRIDTVRLYSANHKRRKHGNYRLSPEDFSLEEENDGGRYELNSQNTSSRGMRIALATEFALACALCGAIFLTNVFMPHSAINTFFRAMSEPVPVENVDARTYSDFTLAPIVSELSDAELSLSDTGILSFTDACCVYPAANGTITEVAPTANNGYSVKIQYSDSFTGIINGLNTVYYSVGDKALANIPIGYTNGENEVQVTMYSDGTLLNCFELTEENCLAWLETE